MILDVLLKDTSAKQLLPLLKFQFRASVLRSPLPKNLTIEHQTCTQSKNTISSEIVFSFYEDKSHQPLVSVVFLSFFFLQSDFPFLPHVCYISEQQQNQVTPLCLRLQVLITHLHSFLQEWATLILMSLCGLMLMIVILFAAFPFRRYHGDHSL